MGWVEIFTLVASFCTIIATVVAATAFIARLGSASERHADEIAEIKGDIDKLPCKNHGERIARLEGQNRKRR